jgi:hypothetical protein
MQTQTGETRNENTFSHKHGRWSCLCDRSIRAIAELDDDCSDHVANPDDNNFGTDDPKSA